MGVILFVCCVDDENFVFLVGDCPFSKSINPPLINNQIGFTAVFSSHFVLDGNSQGILMRLTSRMKVKVQNRKQPGRKTTMN